MDRNRLGLVFRNLIENAIQHSPAHSEVAVSVGPGREGGRDLVEVRVEDSGPGFREEDLPQIFAPFFTRRRGGTGLGLSIVHKVVLEHGGQVAARTGPGGAVLGEAAPRDLGAGGPGRRVVTKGRVLLVEDEPGIAPGTVFLDEIGDMELTVQPRLLRALAQ